jgi:hypothetical protein
VGDLNQAIDPKMEIVHTETFETELQVEFILGSWDEETQEELDSAEEDAIPDPDFHQDVICNPCLLYERSDADSGIHDINLPPVPTTVSPQVVQHKELDIVIHSCESCRTKSRTTRRSPGSGRHSNTIAIMSGHVNPAYADRDVIDSDSDSSVFFEETWEEVTTVYIDPKDQEENKKHKCGLVTVLCKCFNDKEQTEATASITNQQSVKQEKPERTSSYLSSQTSERSLQDYASDFCRGCRTRIFPNLVSIC